MLVLRGERRDRREHRPRARDEDEAEADAEHEPAAEIAAAPPRHERERPLEQVADLRDEERRGEHEEQRDREVAQEVLRQPERREERRRREREQREARDEPGDDRERRRRPVPARAAGEDDRQHRQDARRHRGDHPREEADPEQDDHRSRVRLKSLHPLSCHRRRACRRCSSRRRLGAPAVRGVVCHAAGHTPSSRRPPVSVWRRQYRMARRRRLRPRDPGGPSLSEPLRGRRRDGDRAASSAPRSSAVRRSATRSAAPTASSRARPVQRRRVRAPDYAIASARAHGIKLIATIVGDDADDGGGGCVYLGWRGISQPDCSLDNMPQFWTDPNLIGDVEAHIAASSITSTSTRTSRSRMIRRSSAGIC